MSDIDPTRANEPVDQTAMMPPVRPPTTPRGPDGGDAQRRNMWLIISALVAIIVVLGLILLLGGDDNDNVATGATETTSTTLETTTTSSSTTSTTAETTATTEAPTTSTAPKTTIPSAQCNPKTSPAAPGAPATTFHEAWRVSDRDCAEKLGTDDAVDTLFDLEPNGPEWEFQGCTEVAEPDPHADCAFTYEGGSAHFNLVYGAINGWSIYEVYFVAD